MRRTAVLVALLLVAGACASEAAAPPTGEAGLSLVGPYQAEVGTVPRFEWSEVDGAATYRLVVLGQRGPIWAWEGEETSVNLGGLSGDRPELMPGPVVEAGTSWSVVALGPAGEILDLVGPIEIAPADGSTSETEAPSTTTSRELSADDLPDPCSLVSQADVDAVFGGSSPDGEPGSVTGPGGTSGGRRCSWSAGFASLDVSIFIRPSFLTPMEMCGNCEAIAGYGDEAWGGVDDRGSGGAILAISVGGLGVQAGAYGLEATVEQLEALAAPVLAGLP